MCALVMHVDGTVDKAVDKAKTVDYPDESVLTKMSNDTADRFWSKDSRHARGRRRGRGKDVDEED